MTDISGGSSGGVTDAELLARIRQGRPSDGERAFREIVARHGRYLFGVARALTRDAHEAEDVVQETFMAVARGASFSGDAAVRTWLVGILVRQAALSRRKRARWGRLTVHGPTGEEPRAESPQLAVDARLDLNEMLERLSPEHR